MENEKKVRGEREVVESAPQLRRHLRTPLRGENKYQYAVKGDGAERDGHPETKTSRRRQLPEHGEWDECLHDSHLQKVIEEKSGEVKNNRSQGEPGYEAVRLVSGSPRHYFHKRTRADDKAERHDPREENERENAARATQVPRPLVRVAPYSRIRLAQGCNIRALHIERICPIQNLVSVSPSIIIGVEHLRIRMVPARLGFIAQPVHVGILDERVDRVNAVTQCKKCRKDNDEDFMLSIHTFEIKHCG